MHKQSLYVGTDWLIYAGLNGYEYSEMLSPAVLLGAADGPLVCQWTDGIVTSSCLLHPAGVWSSLKAPTFILIYFEPVSAAGSTLQRFLGAPSELRPLLKYLGDHPQTIAKIMDATFTSSEATHLIEKVRIGLEKLLGVKPEDPRVRRVAEALSENPAGRLDLKCLAKIANLSTNRLRHLFKMQTGTTLSKYKSWRQIHTMLCHLVKTRGSIYDWRTQGALQSAGFYDDSHGYRTISQYFGPRSSMYDLDLILINCLE